ncbi:MAG: hypothetical protein IV100_16075, partial [Myxococcales bacterium]|nr:hypothetical protein [Myxococcales bacterium]
DETDGSDAVDGADVTDGADAADAVDGSDAVDGGELSFQHVYDTVFVPKGCSAGYCHGAGSGGMQFGTHEEAYAELVNKPATVADCGLATRVVPGAPDDSVLWARVRPESGPACSAQKMPSGTSGLDDASAQLVYDWIQDGAKP